MIKFLDFNDEINPADDPIYIPLWHGRPAGRITAIDAGKIKTMALGDPNMETGMFLPEDIVVITIRDRAQAAKVLDIIKKQKTKALVATRGATIEIYCRSTEYKNKKGVVLGCGASASMVTGFKKDYIIIPFKSPASTSPYLSKVDIVYYNGIGALPAFLKPLLTTKTTHIEFPIESGDEMRLLMEHKGDLDRAGFDSLEVQRCLDIINDNICASPVDPATLGKIMVAKTAVVSEESFFKDRMFLHNKMAEYLLEECHIKKGMRGDQLYHFNKKSKIYESNESYLKGVIARTVPSLRDGQRNEVLKFTKDFLEFDKVKFNRNPYKIVFRNVILDITTMKTEPLTPDHLETIQLDCDYDPSATSTTADEFFNTATCGDKDVEQLLYESIGYSFLKTVELTSSFILTGEGRNGKSTFLDLIGAILGEGNSTAVDFKSLGNNFRVGNLYGKLASLAGDISSTPLSDSDLYKGLVSGDKILVERKYEQAFEEALFATMFFSCNRLPRTPDTTYGFYRRLVIIPFNANLAKVTPVDGAKFKMKLLSDESKAYVAYKAVQAIHNVINVKYEFTRPKICSDMLEGYRIENSTPLKWGHEQLDIGKTLVRELHTLYAEYKIWCEMNGFKPYGLNRFEAEVMEEFKLDKTFTSAGKVTLIAKKP